MTRRHVNRRKHLLALGMRAVGVTIVTAQGRGRTGRLSRAAATHVTADPPSMLVSTTTRALKPSCAAAFAINCLAGANQDLTDSFASG